MAPLKTIFVAVALVAAAPAHARSVERWRPYVEEASARFDVPVDWIERVMRAESGGRTRLGGRPIRSAKGAMGLMQLMPGTWAEVRSTLGLGTDPDDPRDNILAGTFYLRAMYDRFGYPGCFAAYNAGPARYRAWLAGKRSLPSETIGYLAAVGARVPQEAASTGDRPGMFVVRRNPDRAPDSASSGADGAAIFFLRKVPQ
ncbi:lytic transglycosylase domain-containing protein [Sphingomonas suaedae]|uniref:Lytic transglycosylase domain-containing protein n=1 Tax=Sphingomonas suaedae TaxID=2599297 RepID=A0A518RCM4_9SPHN|nr:lytic transglycosylase domain-containing protein [Sphingomonas suaedae]QDX25215.1 lytic transglycosylase domain-containing protein [Sphingomonas suaedae]